eukprot:763837-Hanusia_phi.AAC.6
MSTAAKSIQDAWRKYTNWKAFVKAEMAKARKQAKMHQKEYLFGGKSQEELKKLRESAGADFESNTSELGRSRVNAMQDKDKGLDHATATPFEVWMETLHALMQREKGEEQQPVARKRIGMKSVLEFSNPSNPDDVSRELSKQRGSGGRSLQLTGMNLKRWPYGISDKLLGRPVWYELTSVFLSENHLAGLPQDFYVLTNLVELRLNNNQIKTISPSVGDLTKLNSIWLHNNMLTTLPFQISLLKELSFLSLNDNSISFLPFQLASLSKLSKLPLHNNAPLKTPPSHLAKESYTQQGCFKVLDFLQRFAASMQNPFKLDMENFDMTAVPELNLTTKCKVISLSRNMIAEVPQEVFLDMKFAVPWHPHLRCLDLSCNLLETFPAVLFQLPSLKALDLSNNRLNIIPVEILNLSKLEQLNVDFNPLVSPPPPVVARGLYGCFFDGDLQDETLRGFYVLSSNERSEQKFVKLSQGKQDKCLTSSAHDGTTEWRLHGDNAEVEWSLRSSDRLTQEGMWLERRQGRTFVNRSVRLHFHGILEYSRRVMNVREQTNEILRLKEKIGKERKKMSLQDLRVTKQMYKEKLLNLSLDLSYLELHTIPVQIEDKLIRKLILDNNLITVLPTFIFHLPLIHLSFNYNLVNEIPHEISKLGDLEILSYIGNEVKLLPKGLRQNIKLSSIFAASNNMKMVGAVLADLEQIEYLNFSYNPISLPTPHQDSMSSLRVLDLSHCGFDNSLQVVPPLAGLVSLNVSDNRLTQIPPSVYQMTSIQTLVLSRNNIQSDNTGLEHLFKHCKLLQVLDLSGNALSSFPAKLVPSLGPQRIDLSLNHLDAFPVALRGIANLQVLNLSRNYINAIPPECVAFTSLQELVLSVNKLRLVAAEIRNCTSLQVLDLSDNQLTRLPPCPGMSYVILGNLQMLRVLDVSRNELEFLPQDICLCSRLQSLRCQGNSLLSQEVGNAEVGFCGKLLVTVKKVTLPPPKTSKMNFVHMEISLTHSSSGAFYAFQTASRACTTVAEFDQTFQFMISDVTSSVVLRLKSEHESHDKFDHSLEFSIKYLLLSQVQILLQYDKKSLTRLSEACTFLQGSEGMVVSVSEGTACSLAMLVRGEMRQLTSTGVKTYEAGAMLGRESLVSGASLDSILHLSSDAILFLVPQASLSQLLRSSPARLPYLLVQHEIQLTAGGLERFCEEVPQKLLSQSERQEYVKKLSAAAASHKFSSDEEAQALQALEAIIARLESAFPNFESIALSLFDPRAQCDYQLSASSLDLSRSLVGHAGEVARPEVSLVLSVQKVSILEGFRYIFQHGRTPIVLSPSSPVGRGSQDSMELAAAEEEFDWKREEEESRAIDRSLEETSDYISSLRAHRMWESMQLMYIVQGSADRPWDHAHDRRSDLAAGHFYGMKHVLHAMMALQHVSDMPTSNPGRNYVLLKQIQASEDARYRRRSLAEEGSQDRGVRERPVREAPAKREAVDSWEWLCGRMMLNPKLISKSRAQVASLALQDWQLMAVRAMQENGNIEYKIRRAGERLELLQTEMEEAEADQMRHLDRLSKGWDRQAAAQLKATNERAKTMSRESEALRFNRNRLKALLHLKTIEDSKQFSLSGTRPQDVFDAVVEQAEPGSLVSRDASLFINDELSPSGASALLASWTLEDLGHWLDVSEALARRSPEERQVLVEKLRRFNIRARMFVHLSKEDLLRMKVRSAEAWSMLLAVEELRRQVNMPPRAEINLRLAEKLSEMKLRPAVLTLLGKDFNIREQDMTMILDVFKRYDRDDVDEVQPDDLSDVCAECHLRISDQQLESLKRKLGVGDKDSLDFISFCQMFQEARAMATDVEYIL